MNFQNFNISHLMCICGGAIWGWIEPAIPFALLCIFAVLLDCLSAWRLNRRVWSRYGQDACDGKLKSVHMKKMIGDLFMLFGCILIAQGVDDFCLSGIDLYLGNIIAAIYLLTTLVSILENESSCSDLKWAVLVQKVVADKTYRHLNIELVDAKQEGEQATPDGRHFPSPTLSVMLLLFALFLTSCRSTQSYSESKRNRSVETARVMQSSDSTDAVSQSVDSLYRIISVQDSIIRSVRERQLMHTGAARTDFTHVRDSVSVHTDSLGNLSFHYWTFTDHKEVVHDTLYIDNVREVESREVYLMRDSIAAMRASFERYREQTARLDSIYFSTLDSMNNSLQVVTVKSSVWDKFKNAAFEVVVFFLSIAVSVIVVVWAIRKLDNTSKRTSGKAIP